MYRSSCSKYASCWALKRDHPIQSFLIQHPACFQSICLFLPSRCVTSWRLDVHDAISRRHLLSLQDLILYLLGVSLPPIIIIISLPSVSPFLSAHSAVIDSNFPSPMRNHHPLQCLQDCQSLLLKGWRGNLFLLLRLILLSSYTQSVRQQTHRMVLQVVLVFSVRSPFWSSLLNQIYRKYHLHFELIQFNSLPLSVSRKWKGFPLLRPE